MKKLCILLLSLTLVLSYSAFAYADNFDVPEEVQNVAIKSLDFAKGKITADPEKWGFNKDDDINSITLGDGYRLRYLDGDKLMDSTSNNLMDITFESDFWQYIVYLNGEAKIFLTVGFEDGEYKMVQMGGNAKNLDATLTNFHNLAIKTANEAKPIMAKIQGNYFLILQNSDKTELALPLIVYENAKGISRMDNNSFVKSSEIVTLLRENAKESSGEINYGGSFNTPNIQESRLGVNQTILLLITILVLLIPGITFALRHYNLWKSKTK